MPKPRCILIDPWLADGGGHNYQYALDVLETAEEQGYGIVLAAQQAVSAALTFPASWRVLRLFRFGVCSRYWLGPDGRNGRPCDLDGAGMEDEESPRGTGAGALVQRVGGAWRRCRDVLARYDRRRRILDFARGCARVLDLVQPSPGDLFFLPSLSEFDFLGVARFLRDDARTLEFVWHLQFHFNIFTGRDPEFAAQACRLRLFQRQFEAARRAIPDHALQFYATTAAMARQFDHIGVGSFRPLPYPVRQTVRATGLPSGVSTCRSSYPERPWQVTFAGGMRREKGKKRLGALIAAVWPDCLANRRMQFVFQASPRQVKRALPRELKSQAIIAGPGRVDEQAPLRTVAHPLGPQAYAELIRSTDLAIFLYDSRRYYARASGILGEMLAAGVPVIVPAGCWLADQLSGPNDRHVARLASDPDDVLEQWDIPLTPRGAPANTRLERTETIDSESGRIETGRIETGTHGHTAFRLPTSTSDLALQCRWPDVPWGTYLEIGIEFCRAGKSVPAGVQRSIMGRPESGSSSGMIVPVPAGTHTAHVAIRSAYNPLPLDGFELRATALRAPATAEHHPRGAVGLVAAGEEQVPDLLRDILAHGDHYRARAIEYSRVWCSQHHPQRTLEILEESQRAYRPRIWKAQSA